MSERPDPDDPAFEALDDALEAAYGRPPSLPPDASVLLRLEQTGVEPPRVLLRDARDEEPPLVRPGSREAPGGRYQTVGEIARGGVGVILKCRDVDLGRDVAMKVLQDGHADNQQLLERFVEEAQVGGQLQHPGIVPVYEMGLTDDKRPYFTMKFVKGDTLAVLLSERDGPEEGRRKLLGVFEQICMTVGYAHSRGVIHRDLKPANVIVGAFGEVMVVDWGFAKVLTQGGVADEQRAAQRSMNVTVVQTLRSGSGPGTGGTDSIVGSVMGTPSYMPPEQAIGDVDAMTARSDVFSLGAILCEILTGLPPYPPGEVSPISQAAQARLEDAFERLDGCGAGAALVDLAKRCLDPVPSKRPANAARVGSAIADHLHAVEERARQSQLEAARERVRAEGERKRRRLVIGLAAAVLIAAGGFVWAQNERNAKVQVANRSVGRVLEEANLHRGKEAWEAAFAKVAEAREAAAEADADTLAQIDSLKSQIESEREAALARADAERKAQAFVHDLDELRAWWGEGFNAEIRERRFASLLGDLDAEAVRSHVAASSIRLALDAWGKRPELLAAVDDDPVRGRIRGLNQEGLEAIVAQGEWRDGELETMALLAERVGSAGRPDLAVEVYRHAVGRDTEGFFPKLGLGWWLTQKEDPDISEAIGYFVAALTQRPESLAARYQLGRLLSDRDERTSAFAHWRRICAADADYADVKQRLVEDLKEEAEFQQNVYRPDEALTLAQEATSWASADADVLALLGESQALCGDVEAGRETLVSALRIDPEQVRASLVLSQLDFWDGRLDEAERRLRGVHAGAYKTRQFALLHRIERLMKETLRRRLPEDPERFVQAMEQWETKESWEPREDKPNAQYLNLRRVNAVSWWAQGGRPEKARKLADEILRDFETNNPQALPGIRRRAAIALEDWDTVLSLTEDLYKGGPRATDAAVAWMSAQILDHAGRIEEAEAAWRRAAGLVAKGIETATDGSVHNWTEFHYQVYTNGPASLRNDFDSAWAHHERFWHVNRKEMAHRSLTRLRNDTFMRRRRAEMLAAAGRHEEAVRLFRELGIGRSILAVEGEITSIPWFARSCLETGDTKNARRLAGLVVHYFTANLGVSFDYRWTGILRRAQAVLDDLDGKK